MGIAPAFGSAFNSFPRPRELLPRERELRPTFCLLDVVPLVDPPFFPRHLRRFRPEEGGGPCCCSVRVLAPVGRAQGACSSRPINARKVQPRAKIQSHGADFSPCSGGGGGEEPGSRHHFLEPNPLFAPLVTQSRERPLSKELRYLHCPRYLPQLHVVHLRRRQAPRSPRSACRHRSERSALPPPARSEH